MKRFKYESGTLLSKDETISENLCMLLLTGEIMLCNAGLRQFKNAKRRGYLIKGTTGRFHQQATKVRKDSYTCDPTKEVVYVPNYSFYHNYKSNISSIADYKAITYYYS
ncbi:hypothetical protein ACSQ67_007230 [Phaseolus vulgaris]